MFHDSPMFSTFSVDDLDAARAFYGGTLGLEVKDTPMGILEVNAGADSRVLIYPKPDHQPATFTVLNFPVADIGSKVDALTTAGVTMQRYDSPDIRTDERGIAGGDEYGPKIAWFKDPAGNILSVIEDPSVAAGA
jgi:catechol 2,3-dioxygenase-like lactoylglutathione lyase family enzyme